MPTRSEKELLATVVIPNWNGMKYLETCLDSLRNQDTKAFQTLVVDNASGDGSVAFLKERYPEVRVIENASNLGFSGGVNVGIRKTETPYVILLNNDTECDPGFVRHLLEAAMRDPKIFSVSSRMIRFSERTVLDDAGDLYTVLGYQAQRGTGEPAEEPRYLKPARVFSACAGAAIYRRAVFDEIGLFDEDHFAYLEDIDVGYRAMLYGYKNVYEPSAVVYHVGSGASGAVQYSEFKVRLSARNSRYLVYKNMPLFFRILNALPLCIGRAVKRRFFKKRGFAEAYAAGEKEAKEKKGMLKQVPMDAGKFFRHFGIEGRMIAYTFTYVFSYLRRRSLKKGAERGRN